MLLLCTILLPLVGGAILPLLRLRTLRATGICTFLITLATSALALCLLLQPPETLVLMPDLVAGCALAFHTDGLSRVFVGLIALLWPLAVLYATEYMRHEERPNAFFSWYTLSYGVTLAIATAANLLTLYIFFECLTLVTLPLVTHKRDAASIRAGRRYAVYSFTGAAMGFCGLCVLLSVGAGGFVFGGSVPEGCPLSAEALRWLYLLAFVGFGTKAAVLPMSAWLPEASVAPTPVTALLHAVAVVNAGAFSVLRVTWYSFGTGVLSGSFAQTAALAIACATVLFGSAMAVKEQHLKRRLAWSTVSNLSYMLMGAALMTASGLVGALTHLVFHGLMKITLFFCAGAYMVQSGRAYVHELRGYGRVMPLTTAAFTIGAVALVGTPPLVGFVSKWNLLTAASATQTPMGTVAVCTLIISSVLTAIYLFTVVMACYFRPLNAEDRIWGVERHDPTWRMLIPLALLCALMLLLGLSSTPLTEFFAKIAAGTV